MEEYEADYIEQTDQRWHNIIFVVIIVIFCASKTFVRKSELRLASLQSWEKKCIYIKGQSERTDSGNLT
jgi:hypothetical protein